MSLKHGMLELGLRKGKVQPSREILGWYYQIRFDRFQLTSNHIKSGFRCNPNFPMFIKLVISILGLDSMRSWPEDLGWRGAPCAAPRYHQCLPSAKAPRDRHRFRRGCRCSYWNRGECNLADGHDSCMRLLIYIYICVYVCICIYMYIYIYIIICSMYHMYSSIYL